MQLSLKTAHGFENHSRFIIKKTLGFNILEWRQILFSVTRFCDRRSEMSVLNSTGLYVGNISIPLFDRNSEVDIANRQWPWDKGIIVGFPADTTNFPLFPSSPVRIHIRLPDTTV